MTIWKSSRVEQTRWLANCKSVTESPSRKPKSNTRNSSIPVTNIARQRNHILTRRNIMRTILLVILVLLLVGALPTWPYSSGWGYYPSGGLGLVLLIVIIIALLRCAWRASRVGAA